MKNNNSAQFLSKVEESTDRKLTIAEFKACPGCEHYTDEEAEEITTTLYHLTIFLFERTVIDIPDNNFANLKQAA